MAVSRTLWSFESEDALEALRAKPEYLRELRTYAGVSLDEHAAAVIYVELVGNVARHAPGPIKVRVTCEGGDLVLSVADTGPGFRYRERPAPDPSSESGRGLFIVAQYARAVEVVAGRGESRVVAVLRPMLSQVTG